MGMKKRAKIFIILAAIALASHIFIANAAYGDEGACPGDADCDGLLDAREDLNGNGVWDKDLGETDFQNPDSDGDGLTDGEEVLHTGKVGALLARTDIKVRFPDRFDPLNPDSDGDCLPDGLEAGVTGEEMTALFDSVKKKKWRYEFTPICADILSKNYVTMLENAIPYDDSPPSLYNVRGIYDMDPATVTDPTSDDTDGDGMMDGHEDFNFNGRVDVKDGEEGVFLETSPQSPDSDGDGLPDGEEGDRDGDGTIGPDESDPTSADTDADGVSDGDEARAGTKKNTCDTDGDGLSDGVEMGRIQPNEKNGCHGLMAAGSNYRKPTAMDPLNPDSDGDGLTDGEEDKNGNGWVDSDEGDPSVVDSDGDGLDDGLEARGDFDGDGNPDFDYRNIHGSKGCSPPESVVDVDCDGVPNARDDDSDNDGCPDITEGPISDLNSNNIPDVYDPASKVCPDEAAPAGNAPTPAPDEGGEGDEARSRDLIFGGKDGGACSLVPAHTPRSSLFSTLFLILPLFLISIRRLSKTPF
jgi:hypothetical protein